MLQNFSLKIYPPPFYDVSMCARAYIHIAAVQYMQSRENYNVVWSRTGVAEQIAGEVRGWKKKWEKKERYIFDLDKYIWKTIIFHRFELIVIFLFIFLNGSTRFLLTICRIVAIWLDLFPRHLICDIRNIKWLFKDERFRNCANSESGIIHLFPGRIRSYSIIRHSIPEF